mgnify:FL=1|jgi:hypothetical protein
MKKVILVVSAVAFLLSVNFAMARPPVPVRFPVDPTIQYILDWLEDLQISVNQLFGRVSHLEQNPPNSELTYLWQDFYTVEEMNDSEFIDVTGYTYARLHMSWSGDETHPCQYAYRYSDDGETIVYDSTFLGSSCHISEDIPLAGSQYLQIGAYTPPDGVLNSFLYLYNSQEGPIGPEGPVGPQGEQGPTGPVLHLYDGSDQDLGTIITARHSVIEEEDFLTYNSNLDVFTAFHVNNESGFIVHDIPEIPPVLICFEQPDCQGNSYISDMPNISIGEHTMIKGIGRYFKYNGDDWITNQQVYSCINGQYCENEDYRTDSFPIPEVFPPLPLYPYSIVME